MKPHKRILVVGTTVDYVEILANKFSNRVLFLTDLTERNQSKGWQPAAEQEILAPLSDKELALKALTQHLKQYFMELSGVVCFDCESLVLAAQIAQNYSLSFPSLETIRICRSKFLTKKVWQDNGVPCPAAELIETEEQVVQFFNTVKQPIVLKPLTGSGSELIFFCDTEDSSRKAYRIIDHKIKNHPNQRMYHEEQTSAAKIGAETYAKGDEYSCDFLLEGENLTVIRLSKKIPLKGSNFGAVLAYSVPSELPIEVSEAQLVSILKKASHSLGLTRALAMVDFKIDNGAISLLELTPRPGGDCLPPLIKASSGFDTLKAALDFSEEKKLELPAKEEWGLHCGLQLLAQTQGIIRKLDNKKIRQDPRVVACHLKRSVGNVVTLPPDDYESRILGSVIFKPTSKDKIEDDCRDLINQLEIEIN